MDEILELLRCQDDNKKFAGLYLVTKLVPSGELKSDIMRLVMESVGAEFVTRLILPLRGTPDPSLSLEDRETQLASIGLGLSILSVVSTSQDLAADPILIEHTPLLLKVLKHGGVELAMYPGGLADPAKAGPSERGGGISPEPALHAVQAVLDTLANIAQASDDGLQISLQCGAVAAVARALQDPGITADASTAWRAVGYLRALLNKSSDILYDQAQIVFTCIAPLALVFGRTPQPPIAAAQSSQNTSSGAAAAAADTASPMDVASASPAQSDGAAQSDTAAAAGAAASDAGVSGTDDAGAKMQLEALHVLLMIMQASPGGELWMLQAASAKAEAQGWPAGVRAGVTAVLQARAPFETRQAALAVVAAMMDLCGQTWLLGGPPVKGVQGGFLQLVLELTAVEVQVLLKDALRGSAMLQASSDTVVQLDAVPVKAAMALPSCYRLLEAAVGAYIRIPDNPQTLQWSKDGTLKRLLDTLDTAFEAVLEFLEVALEPSPDSLGDGMLTLAALKCLCSYLAQLPHAHGESMRALLPRLLALTGGNPTMRRGKLSNAGAVAFLSPFLKQVVHGLEGRTLMMLHSPDEREEWVAAMRNPQVIDPLATAIEDLALETPEDYLMAAPDSDDAMGQVADLCSLLLVTLEPRRSDEDAPGWRDSLTPGIKGHLLSMARALGTRFAKFPNRSMLAASVPASEIVRSEVASGAAAAVVMAEVLDDLDPEAMRGTARLLGRAVELGFRVGCDLRRPPDVGGNDDEMTALVDEVQDWWSRLLPAAAALVTKFADKPAGQALTEELKAQASVKEMMEASDEKLAGLVGSSQAGPSPALPLLQALGRPEPVARRGDMA